MNRSSKRRRECRPHERRWRDRCVDRNLVDEWLERLNKLENFRLVGICEGHFVNNPQSTRVFPRIHLALKGPVLPGLVDHWSSLKSVVVGEVERIFGSGDANYDLELRFNARRGPRGLAYRQILLFRVRCPKGRVSAQMDVQTQDWFSQTVARIEQLDRFIQNLEWPERLGHRCEKGSGAP